MYMFRDFEVGDGPLARIAPEFSHRSNNYVPNLAYTITSWNDESRTLCCSGFCCDMGCNYVIKIESGTDA
jgi:hypothetical protein